MNCKKYRKQLNKHSNAPQVDELTSFLERTHTHGGTIYAEAEVGTECIPLFFGTAQISPKRENTVTLAERLSNIKSGFISLANHSYQKKYKYSNDSVSSRSNIAVSVSADVAKNATTAEKLDAIYEACPNIGHIFPTYVIDNTDGTFSLVWCCGWNIQELHINFVETLMALVFSAQTLEKVQFVRIPGSINPITGKTVKIIYADKNNYIFDGLVKRFIFDVPVDTLERVERGFDGFHLMNALKPSTPTKEPSDAQLAKIKEWYSNLGLVEKKTTRGHWFLRKQDLLNMLKLVNYDLGPTKSNDFLFVLGNNERILTSQKADIDAFLKGINKIFANPLDEDEVERIAKNVIAGPDGNGSIRYYNPDTIGQMFPMYLLGKMANIIYDPITRQKAEQAKKQAAEQKRLNEQKRFEKNFIKQACECRYVAELARRVNRSRTNTYTYLRKLANQIQSALYLKANIKYARIKNYVSRFSKASAADGDPLPVYGDLVPVFSGRRISRGQYKTADGTIINADINGAANIMRKAGLGSPAVKSVPVKRIGAA